MPVDKQVKYDRQLRLWANNGQSRLEASHICLVNGNSTGAEILKNLVLPGIGSFSIIDDRLVTQQSLSSNFFLSLEDVGTSVACAVTRKLVELNGDVEGFAIERSVGQVLKTELASFWDKFSTVIVSNYVRWEEVEELREILWEKKIPLFLVNTVGFYGSVHLVLSETTVVETHDPAKFYDLRIDKPWPELQEYADTIDLDEVDDNQHAHIPYIIIFIKALQLWNQRHQGQIPQDYRERTEFKKLVESMARDLSIETNFIEASKVTHRALQVTQIPPSLLQLFANPLISNDNLNMNTPLFWIYIRALSNFTAKNDRQLPLPGTVPDMTSDTANFVKLQSIYRKKAAQDQLQFTHEVKQIFRLIGRSEEDVNPASIASFCKNTHFLHVTQGSKNFYNQSMLSQIDRDSVDSDAGKLLSIYFSILAFNSFQDRYHRVAGGDDLQLFESHFKHQFLAQESEPSPYLRQIFAEMLNHNSADYHNLCSFIGGVAGQEVLKFSTGQYTPLDNLFVFDGIRSISDKWKI